MEKINTIIWDWNGTLLDDAEICRNIINKLLSNRGIKQLSMERYQEIFTFPVKDYYIKAGFDFSKEDFSKPADAFINEYNKHITEAPLHKQVKEVLEKLKVKGFKQIIISAMKQDALIKSVQAKKIDVYFKKISGINNHYANGKLENAKSILKELNLKPDNCCLIGDTIHDHEVAKSLGCRCILISNGHQNHMRLEQTQRKVLKNIDQVLNYF